MQNLEQTIISQYANSPILLTLINGLNVYIDPSYNFDQFYLHIWNIASADGYGLDVWGRILGVSRTLNISTGTPYLGFEQQTEAYPFDQAPFYDALTSGSATTNFNLSDPSFLTLLYAKALANITNGSIPAINQILINLFVAGVPGRTGNAYCTDGGNMTMTYTFHGLSPALTSVELAIIGQSGVLPRPCGVSATVVQS